MNQKRLEGFPTLFRTTNGIPNDRIKDNKGVLIKKLFEANSNVLAR
jgi:hypothetical protein